MSHSIGKLMFIFSILVTWHRVNGLKENETVTDDFDSGKANFWQLFLGQDSTTFWHLSMHGDPPPFGIEAVRPPMEETGGGFLEIVPFSDSPAQIFSNIFDVLPGATVEMTYWNRVPFPITERNTVLNLYVEFQNIAQSDDISSALKTVQVFNAPFPTDPLPGWTTVIIVLPITEPANIQLRIDGIRRNLATTGLAVSKITIKNGLDVSTTTISTSTTELTSPTKYAVDKTTATTASNDPITDVTSDGTGTATESITPTAYEVDKTTDSSTLPSPATELIPSGSSSKSTSSPSTSTSFVPPGVIEVISSSSTTSLAPSGVTEVTGSSSITSTTSSSSTSPISTITKPTVPSTSTGVPSNNSSSTVDPTTPSSPTEDMSTNQLRGVLISVGVSILLFSLFCLLFTILYRRHRRRAYLIGSRQMESGIIRTLEKSVEIPYSPHKTESDSSSISSTTDGSDFKIAPNRPVRFSIGKISSVR